MRKKLKFSRIAVDKYLDVRYGDENFFEFLGKDAYKAMSTFLHEDCQEQFREVFEAAGDKWTGTLVRLRGYDGEYRNAYIEIRKQDRLVNGLQLWDIQIYEIEGLVEGYHEQLLKNRDYKVLISLKETDYLRYEHSNGSLSFCRMVNERELILSSMSLEEWKKDAIYLRHVDAKDSNVFQKLCKDIEDGRERFSMEMGTSLISGLEEIKPCYIEGATIFTHGKPYHTLVTIELKENNISSQKKLDMISGKLDPLTGLFNKKVMTDKARGILNGSSDNVALFILDVDNFKGVNDNFGHMFGDKVLTRVAQVISEVIGDNGFAGRIGGDEFMGIFENIADRADMKGRLRSIRSRIEFLFADVPGVNITCSIGACQKMDGFVNYEDIFSCADKCLYMAKDKGKNRYIMYTPDIHGSILKSSGGLKNIKSIIHNKNENRVMNDIIILLYREKYSAIPKVMKKFIEELEFDRVSVYYGEGLKRIMYKETIDSVSDYAFFANSYEYINQFDENGVAIFSNIYRFEEMDKSIYDAFVKQHTECLIQVMLGTKQNPKGIISFECCSGEKRFSDPMLNFVTIVAKLINEIIEENIERE